MSADRVADIWGARTPHPAGAGWPQRADQFLLDGIGEADVDRWVRGACLLCSNGCGLEVAVRDGRMVGVRGRAEDRVNHGRLDPKGLYGWQGQQHDRLTAPLIREGGRLVETDWDTAMGRVVERSQSLLRTKGPLTHGFYTSGQLMIEEYYTLAVIGKAGIGTPHWAAPTDAMAMFRYAEQGSIGFLWIAGTNPAVSMPDLARIRRILSGDQCFVVVSDGYRTETTELADVVLPAALWAEKTGTFTNVDRTVHLQEQAVDPPGSARSDLAIWLDYARRLRLTDKDGAPLPAWDTPEQAFEAWKAASAGRPCDYSGLTYATLHDVGGMQWPVTTAAPDGTERLYRDGVFPTDPEVCETYGHDLATGATVSENDYRARRPDGRAILKSIAYETPFEEPDAAYPLRLTTGRTAYHFHTRTKTSRSHQLNEAAPAMWVELSEPDADRLGVTEGDIVRVTSRRGSIQAPARVTYPREGVVFAPWHYGNGDTAANELTLNGWDPVSKQPEFKVAAVAVERVGPRQRAGTGTDHHGFRAHSTTPVGSETPPCTS